MPMFFHVCELRSMRASTIYLTQDVYITRYEETWSTQTRDWGSM